MSTGTNSITDTITNSITDTDIIIAAQAEKFRRISARIQPEIIDLKKYVPIINLPIRKQETITAPILSAEEIAENIAAKILPPLMPIRDGRGLICDASTMAIICARKHLHRYFLTDIGPKLKCITCNQGTRRMQSIISAAESIFGAPFIFSGDVYDCRKLKLRIEFGTKTEKTVDGPVTIYKFGPSTKAKGARTLFEGTPAIILRIVNPMAVREFAEIHSIDEKNIIIKDLSHELMLEYC